MIKKLLQLKFLPIIACVFMFGCSTSDNGGGSNGNGGGGSGGVISGDSNINANATSYFLASNAATAQNAMVNVSAAVSRDDDRHDFDDDDGSLLYFKDKDNNIQEVIFNINGVSQRAYVDDLVYAGGNWLLAEIERFAPYTGVVTNSTNRDGYYDDDNDDDDQERLVMINTATAEIKEIPTTQMRNCGNDIEKFEVIGGFGYAICEDSAYKINLTDMSVAKIGIDGNDVYDNAAVTIFSDGAVLVTSKARNSQTNSSSLINVGANVAVNYDAAETYEFTKLPATAADSVNFTNVITGGKTQASLTYNTWKTYIENQTSMGAYYHNQMKFLFGDMRYEDGDEIEVLDRYTKLQAITGTAGISYKFGNFKDIDNKIFTLSLDEEYNETDGALKETSVALSEIAIDATGKISRTVVSKAAVAAGSKGFSGILWNRKDTTSRHLDNQRAFDDKSFFTADLTVTPKTVTKTDWSIATADFTALSNLASTKQGRVYYGSSGIAFVNGADLKYIKYEAAAVANVVTKPVGCTNVSKLSIDGNSLYFSCGAKTTYIQNLTDLAILPTPISERGKMIGNIVEAKKKR